MISFAVRSPSQNVKSIKDAGLPALGLFPISSEMVRSVTKIAAYVY